MSFVTIRGPLRRWGEDYGFRLSRHDVERLGLHPGTEIEVKVDVTPGPKIRADQARSFNLGGDASERHDELFAQGALQEHLESIGERDEQPEHD